MTSLLVSPGGALLTRNGGIADSRCAPVCCGGPPPGCGLVFGPSEFNACNDAASLAWQDAEQFVAIVSGRWERRVQFGGPIHIVKTVFYGVAVDVSLTPACTNAPYVYRDGLWQFDQTAIESGNEGTYTDCTGQSTTEQFILNQLNKFVGRVLDTNAPGPGAAVAEFIAGGDSPSINQRGPLGFLLDWCLEASAANRALQQAPPGCNSLTIQGPSSISRPGVPTDQATPFSTLTTVGTPCNGSVTFDGRTLEWSGQLSNDLRNGSLTYHYFRDRGVNGGGVQFDDVTFDASYSFTPLGGGAPLPLTDGGSGTGRGGCGCGGGCGGC